MTLKNRLMILAVLAGFASPLGAVEVKDPSQAVVEVKGIVCSFCAYGARKNLARVDFLDRKKFKDGLLMETDKGTITMALERGKKVDLTKVYKALKKGGYEVLAIHLNLVGRLQRTGDSAMLTHHDTGQEFDLVDVKSRVWDPKDLLGKEVSIQGVIPEAILSKADPAKNFLVQVKSALAYSTSPASGLKSD